MTDEAFGLWRSQLTPSAMAGSTSLREVGWARDGDTVVWVEDRDGHGVVVARPPQAAQKDLTRDINVRGGVGYGGGEMGVHGDTVFVATKRGSICAVDLDEGEPRALTPEFGGVADPTPTSDGEWVGFVHTENGTDVLGAVDADGERWPTKLASGADFYMQPTWLPDGSRIAWIEWDHPNMPWDQTRLVTARVVETEGGIAAVDEEVWYDGAREGSHDIAYFQPEFGPNGDYLAYVADSDGWWHLHVRDLETGDEQRVTGEQKAEWGAPAWVQGMRTYGWAPDGQRLWAVRNREARQTLFRLNLEDGSRDRVTSVDRYKQIAQPTVSETGRIAFIGSSPRIPSRVVSWAPGEESRVERRSSPERIPAEGLSETTPVSWSVDTEVGTENGPVEVHGNFYPPAATEFDWSQDGDGQTLRPPAIVMVHGGPTSQRLLGWEPRSQFFATRGFAVLDVNYRGSTGYGRDYREALKGEWGVVDVEDVVAGANWLVQEGYADPDRLVVMGGSAGGYTVLQSLVNHPGEFAAGISMYGISNLFELSMDTHKFEQHYNDSLLGTLPEAGEVFRQRSPLFHADEIEDPVALFQGAEDQVVPREQAEAIAESLASRGVPHELEIYEGEGHGWRRDETVEKFYESVLAFLKKHVLFA